MQVHIFQLEVPVLTHASVGLNQYLIITSLPRSPTLVHLAVVSATSINNIFSLITQTKIFVVTIDFARDQPKRKRWLSINFIRKNRCNKDLSSGHVVHAIGFSVVIYLVRVSQEVLKGFGRSPWSFLYSNSYYYTRYIYT